jgi:hypothetical protein
MVVFFFWGGGAGAGAAIERARERRGDAARPTLGVAAAAFVWGFFDCSPLNTAAADNAPLPSDTNERTNTRL